MGLSSLERWVTLSGTFVVPCIFLFRLHGKLLLRPPWQTRLFVAALLLATSGYAVAVANDFGRTSRVMLISLASPLVHATGFVRAHRFFVRKVGRPPVDTFLNWNRGLAADRLFAILFFLSCIYLSWGAILYFGWPPDAAEANG